MMVKTISLAEMKAEFMQDPEFAAAYAEADAEYSVIAAMLGARIAAGMTQAEVAAWAGTTQSAIARLEGGTVSPSIATLRKYARAVGKRLKVEMV